MPTGKSAVTAVTGGPPPPPAAVWDGVRKDARRFGKPVRGYHNRNDMRRLEGPFAHLAELTGAKEVKLRFPLAGAPEVVMRAWPDEARVLEALEGRLPGVPRFLADCGEYTVHSYVPGERLAKGSPPGQPVREKHLCGIADLFGLMTRIDASQLPALPRDWPADGDSTAFLRRLVRFTEERVHQANRDEFGELFDALGIPKDAMPCFEDRIGELEQREFSLLHTDLHRENLIVRPDGRLVAVDWELAMAGDPLHDLATHLCRMRYPDMGPDPGTESGPGTGPDSGQGAELVRRWRAAVPAGASRGMERDLRVYLDFERAQSVYPDIMRAARALESAAGASLARRARKAARRIHGTLVRARAPLGLGGIPPVREIRGVLTAWRNGAVNSGSVPRRS